jgi:hypothetical protein
MKTLPSNAKFVTRDVEGGSPLRQSSVIDAATRIAEQWAAMTDEDIAKLPESDLILYHVWRQRSIEWLEERKSVSPDWQQ